MFPAPTFSSVVVSPVDNSNRGACTYAQLTELNQTFFFVFLEEDEKYNDQINTLFRTVHIGTFNTSVQVC